jgi:hypothetical protein
MPNLGIIASSISGNLWAPGKDFDSIATVTPYTTTTTVVFSSIPSTYRHLQIRWFARSSSLSGLYWTFNGDTGSNYSRHRISADGASIGTSGLASQTSIYSVASWGIPNATSTFAGGVYDILDYKDTNKYKTMRGLAGQDSNTSGGVELISGLWMNTTAINSLTITLATGSFDSNCSFALYGVK